MSAVAPPDRYDSALRRLRARTGGIIQRCRSSGSRRSTRRATSLWKSFGHAAAGVAYVLKTQRNARIHAALAAAVVVLGLFLGLPRVEWAILVVTIGMVFVAEFVNTVVEAIIDLISPQIHPLARVAKDTASGAVLVLAVIAVVVGLLILGPPLYLRLFS